jgi:hypothetical protein
VADEVFHLKGRRSRRPFVFFRRSFSMFSRFPFGRAGTALVIAACVLSGAGPSAQQLPIEPVKESGSNIYPAFEGWYQNADGTYNLLIGYYNRNSKEALDVPIGPNNKIEPGGPDQGQPTHFLPRRGWGVISIKVPKDFGDKKLVWTLTANGRTVSIPFGIVKGYQVEPYKDAAMGNTPPKIRLAENAPELTGPPAPLSTYPTLTGTVGEAIPLTLWIADDGNDEPPATGAAPAPPAPAAPAAAGRAARPRLNVVMSKYRGPVGDIKFGDNTPTIEKDGKATTTATFPAAGEWVIRIEGNDSSGVGGGGFQCCWTTAYVKVNVKAAATGGQ